MKRIAGVLAASCLLLVAAASAAMPKLYIVRFHDQVSTDAPEEVQEVYDEVYGKHADAGEPDWHAVQEHKFERLFEGAAIWLSPAAAQWLKSHPAVADIEEDQEMHIIEPTPADPHGFDAWSTSGKALHANRQLHRDAAPDILQRTLQAAPATRTQSDNIENFGLWNLDRTDQVDAPPYSNSYSYSRDGSGVDVYVVDSGVRQTHVDFGDRALAGFDGINDGLPQASDCNGHGTHVAGTVGGTTVGIAKNATLIAVRVFGCTGGGSTAVILNALEWVSRTAAQRLATQGRRGVVNMSLGGGRSTTFDAATNKLAREGLVVVVAAGNENQDACNTSPAAAELAIAVGATDINDVKATFSNFGPCVDIQAPGVDIFSAYHTADTSANVLDGTSMASPAVAGMAARYLQQRPTATVSEVRRALLCTATQNTLTGLPADGTPNLLMHSTALGLNVPQADGTCVPPTEGGGGPSPPPPTPVTCPNDCSQRGTCNEDGNCICTCGWMGADCSQQLSIQEGQGLTGQVPGDTRSEAATAIFGQESAEVFVALTVPEGVTRLTISTCASRTNFDTYTWLLSACPGSQLSGADVVTANDDSAPGSCAPPASALPPYTPTNFPPPSSMEVRNPLPGRYYVMVEGYQASEGAFALTWDMAAPPGTAVPSASPTPAPHTTISPRPVPSSGLGDTEDDAFGDGAEQEQGVPASAASASPATLLVLAFCALYAAQAALVR